MERSNSRSMPVGGFSVKLCAGAHRRKGNEDRRLNMMEVAAQDIAGTQGGSFTIPGRYIGPLAFAKVARMAHPGHVLPDGLEPGLDETLFYDPVGMGAPSGVHMAYVEVDLDTGMVEILGPAAAADPLDQTHRSPPGKSMAAWSRASALRRCTKK